MSSSNAIDLVEKAYSTDVSDPEWLSHTLEGFTKQFRGVVGCGGYILEKDAAGCPTFSTAVLSGVDDAAATFAAMHATLSPSLAAIIYPTGTRCTGFREDWSKARRAGAWDAGSLEVVDSLQDLYGSYGGDDLLFACSCDHTGAGVFLGAIVNSTKLTDTAREANRLAAVHVAAGLRLRRALAGGIGEERTEAVLEVDGRVVHAEGPATSRDMRAALRRAVANVDRARTRKVRQRELEALDLWLGLVEGRWSVIDRHDTDGRRYYVAITNPPEGVGARQLTQSERRVVSQAIAGEPNGIIAYSLGLSVSRVANLLRDAMRKLGVASRIELMRLAAALGATGSG